MSNVTHNLFSVECERAVAVLSEQVLRNHQQGNGLMLMSIAIFSLQAVFVLLLAGLTIVLKQGFDACTEAKRAVRSKEQEAAKRELGQALKRNSEQAERPLGIPTFLWEDQTVMGFVPYSQLVEAKEEAAPPYRETLV